MKIPLGRSGLFAEIDDSDWGIISRYKWHATGGKIKYTQAYFGGGRRNQRCISMQRLLLNPPPGMQVDHIDGICTVDQNSANTRPHSDSGRRYKGVRFKNDAHRSKPYAARVRFRGKHYNLGHFSTEEEAASAYDKKRIELSGEFAGTNEKVAVGGFA